MRIDVGQPREMERLAAAAVVEFGRIDVWVNNAGAGAMATVARKQRRMHPSHG